jgi:DNA-binding response OmpR family regulator
MSDQKKILVVDDNYDFCEVLQEILSMEGYDAVIALDGIAACAALKDDPYDVVLLDFVMPSIDGLETLKNMREISPSTPVVMISAHSSSHNEQVRKCLAEGAVAAFNKPLDIDALLDAIKIIITGGK